MGMILFFAGLTAGSVKLAGNVGSIDSGKKEIIVNVKSGINLKMGDMLEIETESGRIALEVTYPMLTVTRCKIKGKGKLSSIIKDMPVYIYGKGPVKDIVESDTGVEERFSDNAQGIIKDNKTGLMWLKDANFTRKSMTWDEAMELTEKLEAAGYSDWRMPTKEEFEYLVKIGPAELKKSFDNVRIFYWTSTEYALESGYIWVASVEDRTVNYSFKSNDNYIWPVRDGKTRVRSSVRRSSGDEKIKYNAEQICNKFDEEYASYSKEEDTIINISYGVVCRKGNKESKRTLRYDKILGTWSD